jgi:hypothetical protein
MIEYVVSNKKGHISDQDTRRLAYQKLVSQHGKEKVGDWHWYDETVKKPSNPFE